MKKAISILLCVLWMGFIFYNSSQTGTNSNGLTYRIVDKLISISQEIKQDKGNNVKVYASPNISEASEISSTSISSLINKTISQDRVSLNKELRKAAHAFEFLVLAFLLANAFFVCEFKGRKAIVYILFITLFYAVTDEFHQIYVIGRGSSVKDVLIDFIGGIMGMTTYYIIYYTYTGLKKVRKK